MEIIKDKTGRFPYRLWFKEGEIDSLMEYHLAQFGKTIKHIKKPPMPIELFIEKYLKAELDKYADLEPGVLGATSFYKDGSAEIKIDKSLSESADAEGNFGRLNFTLSHETTHVLCHKELFNFDSDQQDFFASDKLSRIRCFKRDIESYFTKDGVATVNTPWWEFQANVGGGALLMPKTMFLEHFNMERNAYGIKDNLKFMQNERVLKLVIGYLAQTFNASKIAVKVRLTQLGCLPNKRQESIFQTDDMLSIREILREMI